MVAVQEILPLRFGYELQKFEEVVIHTTNCRFIERIKSKSVRVLSEGV